MLEIERKFLVKNDQWKKLASGDHYCQGYLIRDAQTTVRVRIAKGKGFLTSKGKVQDLARPEFEYEIPISEAQEMLDLWCGEDVVKKNRYCIPMDNLVWEVLKIGVIG